MLGAILGGIASSVVGGILSDSGSSVAQGVGSAMGSVGSSIIGNELGGHYGRERARFENTQTLEQMALAPKYQVKGLLDAGLNPMLAYDRVAFPTSSASADPYDLPSANVQAASSARQAEVAHRKSKSEIELNIKRSDLAFHQIRKVVEEYRLTELQAKKLKGFFMAVEQRYWKEGDPVRISTDIELMTYARFVRENEIPAIVASRAAETAASLNRKELEQLLNRPMANEVMKLFQLLVRAWLASKAPNRN